VYFFVDVFDFNPYSKSLEYFNRREGEKNNKFKIPDIPSKTLPSFWMRFYLARGFGVILFHHVISTSSVQSVRSGRLVEKLTRHKRQDLIDENGYRYTNEAKGEAVAESRYCRVLFRGLVVFIEFSQRQRDGRAFAGNRLEWRDRF
jgi:hypothetical protein